MTGTSAGRLGSRLRIVIWGAAALMLLAPLLAMQVTDEVRWDAADFAIFGGMLVTAGGAYELAARVTGDRVYRTAVGLALAGAFTLAWANLAVGVIGPEDHPANLMYFGVLAVGVIGAAVARLQPQGMVRALVATALAQALAALIAMIAGLGSSYMVTGFFVVLWLGSAWLFQRAARTRGSR